MRLFGKKKSSKDWFNEANSHYDHGNWNEAILCYDKVIKNKNEPIQNMITSGNNIGKCFLKLGNYDFALNHFNLVIETDPSFSDAHFHKGVVFEKLGDYENAIECYNKGIEINPQDTDLWYNKGLDLFHLEKNEEAEQCFNKVLEITPNSLDALVGKANALGQLGKIEEAEQCIDKARELGYTQ
jgi:tetratricopeptide (TPR) repeat protein